MRRRHFYGIGGTVKVRDLLETLQSLDPEMEAFASDDSGIAWPIESVAIGNLAKHGFFTETKTKGQALRILRGNWWAKWEPRKVRALERERKIA